MGVVRPAGVTPTVPATPNAGVAVRAVGGPVGWVGQERGRARRCRADVRQRSLVEGRIEGVERSHLVVTPEIRIEGPRWT